MKRLLIIAILATLAGCGSGAHTIKTDGGTIIPTSSHYPIVTDQNGNVITNSQYPLPPAPPQ